MRPPVATSTGTAPAERPDSHCGSVGVPGSVAGMAEAHRRFGKLSWREVVEPAVTLARDGFVIDEYRSRSIAADSARLKSFPASAAIFFPGGKPPAPGTTFRQPELAATLEAIRDSGPAGFYRGRVADLLVAEMKRGGGIITHADLAGYQARWREPSRRPRSAWVRLPVSKR